MRLIDIIYNKYYLPTIVNRFFSKKNNKNKDFTLLVGNCMGGYIYHQLGVKFQTPTINLMIPQNCFYKFISNLKYYLSLDFTEVFGEECPVGMLGDIKVFFTHYNSFEEGVRAWNKRKKRINFNNLFIITSDRDGVTDLDIKNLQSIYCKKMICFTSKKYEYPYCFQVECFKHEKQIGNILGKTIWGKWRFEKFFDYVNWLNSDDVIAEHFKK